MSSVWNVDADTITETVVWWTPEGKQTTWSTVEAELKEMNYNWSRCLETANVEDCIEKKMQQAFNISDKTEVRLWSKYMSKTYEHLNRSDLTMQDAGLYQGTVIIIEEKNADGTWPRQTTNAAGSYPVSTEEQAQKM
ncbi:hypothetical protein NP493_1186g00004 [Ridgeia piscesae]|uniref:Ubiquitin-like domain-containing protein n=1 Tax=Ridgeia piscesae TaxID=27915 RepID=A0AAD9NGU6_RIDPI|nr:hypothetical protein NP493_1186g00004 [Ridgeia piscesae]